MDCVGWVYHSDILVAMITASIEPKADMQMKRQWLCIIFADCIRQLERKLPRLSYNQDLAHIVTTEHLTRVTPACIEEHPITNALSCRYSIHWTSVKESPQVIICLKINVSLPLSPQLVCNQGNHSVVKTTNHFLQWYMSGGEFRK